MDIIITAVTVVIYDIFVQLVRNSFSLIFLLPKPFALPSAILSHACNFPMLSFL